MSQALADSIGISLNEELTLTGVRPDNQVNMITVVLQSLKDSYAEEFNLMAVIVPEAVFEDLFGTRAIHEIALLYDDDRDLKVRRDSVERYLGAAGWETEAVLWNEQARYYNQVVAYYRGFYYIILATAAIIVFFAAGTTVSLSLLERTREFGIRLCLGTRRSHLAGSILTEVCIAGLCGLAAGSLLSLAGALFINTLGGIPMPAAPGMGAGINVLIRFSPLGAALSLVTALLIPMAAAAVPIRRILTRSLVTLLNNGEK
jgi:ABC-type lipoprotein release transport system permease subunit